MDVDTVPQCEWTDSSNNGKMPNINNALVMIYVKEIRSANFIWPCGVRCRVYRSAASDLTCDEHRWQREWKERNKHHAHSHKPTKCEWMLTFPAAHIAAAAAASPIFLVNSNFVRLTFDRNVSIKICLWIVWSFHFPDSCLVLFIYQTITSHFLRAVGHTAAHHHQSPSSSPTS